MDFWDFFYLLCILAVLAIMVIIFVKRQLTKRPAVIVFGNKIIPITYRVLDSKPENSDDAYVGYALYCTNKDQYLQCIDNTNYCWIDTLESYTDFLLDVDGESTPVGDSYILISNFIGSLHCVLVPCKLYKKNYIRTKLFSRDKTYCGIFTESNFTKAMDFGVYYERRVEEATEREGKNKSPSGGNQVSSSVANSISQVNPATSPVSPSIIGPCGAGVPNKPTRPPPMPPVKPPRPPPPPLPRISKH